MAFSALSLSRSTSPAHPLSLCLSLTLLSLPHSYNLIYSNNEQTPGWLELIDSGLDVAVVWGQ